MKKHKKHQTYSIDYYFVTVKSETLTDKIVDRIYEKSMQERTDNMDVTVGVRNGEIVLSFTLEAKSEYEAKSHIVNFLDTNNHFGLFETRIEGAWGDIK